MSTRGGGLRAWIYDRAILPLTTSWYAAVLERLPKGAHVLDVGIGTGGALLANHAIVSRRDLRITGIDIDADYVARAHRAVRSHGLDDRIDVHLDSVYDHRGGPYDAIYFSASFMLLPDPLRALEHVKPLLSGQGRLYFTQTFERSRSRVMERIKPSLRRLTTIDFGRVTYEEEFRAEIEAAGLDLVEMVELGGSRSRSSHLATARLR